MDPARPPTTPPRAASAEGERLRRERAGGPGDEPSLDALFRALLERTSERSGGRPPGLRDWVELAEAWRITRALRECGGNRSAAARSLGIGRRTLYSKMEKLGIGPRFTAPGLEGSAGDR